MSEDKQQKRNVPELRFPEFSGEWEEKKLGDITEKPMYGLNAASTNFDNKNVYIRITDIDEKNRKILKDHLTSPDKINNKYLIEEGDILFARTGASTGKSYIHSTFGNYNFYFAGFLIRFRVLEGISENFVYQNTLTHKFENHVKVMSVRSGQPGMNNKEYSSFSLFLPLYKEQQIIGSFFSKLDQQIELEEKKIALLEEQKKGYVQKIFSQELRFKDENGNDYPEWEIKKLGSILVRGNKDKVEDIGKYKRITISLHGNGLHEVTQERKMKDTRPFYQRFKGELIIGKQNFFNGSIAIVPEKFDGFICSNAIMSYKLNSAINNNFLLKYLLQSDFLRKNEYLADGTGQKELSEKKFENLEIKLPCKKEQRKIGNFFKQADKSIEKQSAKIELLKQYKQGLLQKMFV